MADKTDLHEGQKLTITETRRNASTLTGEVVKVGRSLVHIDIRPGRAYSQIVKFKIDTQREGGDFSSYRFWLPGEYEEHELRGGLIRELRDLGVRFDYGKAACLGSGRLQQILTIIVQED